MSEKICSKKNKIVICVLIFAVLVLAFLLTENIRLENRLKRIGKEFYSDYYTRVEKEKETKNVKGFISDFQNIGIKVSVNTLEKTNAKGNERVYRKLDRKKCDKAKTMLIIYPTKPYGKNDFKIKAKLSCKK